MVPVLRSSFGIVDVPMARPSPDPTIVVPQLDDPHSKPLMAKMARIFRQIGAMSKVKRFHQNLHLPQEARRLSLRAFRLYEQYLTYGIGKLQKKGWRVYCTRGCAACCFSMPAGVSAWEFILIYDHLLDSGQLERFFRKNLESCQVLSRAREQLAAERSGGQPGSKSESERLLYTYSQAKHPCAFLDDSQECLIYSVRPLACRMHFAFTPPEMCDPAHPRFSQAVRLNFRPHGEVDQELERLNGLLNLALSDFLAPGLVTLTANVMRFSPISWT